MADCQWWNEAHTHPDSSGVHSHCEFPVNDITNPFDTTHFTIASVDWDNQTFDVHVKNPDARIYGYQLQFDGVQISQTESLLDPAEGYTGSAFPRARRIDQVLTAERTTACTVPKHTEYVPLLRVHWIGKRQRHGLHRRCPRSHERLPAKDADQPRQPLPRAKRPKPAPATWTATAW